MVSVSLDEVLEYWSPEKVPDSQFWVSSSKKNAWQPFRFTHKDAQVAIDLNFENVG